MRTLTRKQREALLALYNRPIDTPLYTVMTYLAFRRQVIHANYDDCIMVNWVGMWVGIEADGYTHT